MKNILFPAFLLILASAILVNAQFEEEPKTASPFSRHPYFKNIGELPDIASYRDAEGQIQWDKLPESACNYPKFIEAMKEDFERIDENEDGYLYKGELIDWVVREKLVTKDPEESIDDFMTAYDVSKDKKISLQEYLRAAEEYASYKMIPAADIEKLFTQLFAGDAGLEKLKELQDAMNKLNSESEEDSKTETKEATPEEKEPKANPQETKPETPEPQPAEEKEPSAEL